MPNTSTLKIRRRAKELRKSLTSAEEKLWTHLRAHRMENVHFRKQHAIGNYIVDFCAPSQKLIIELDGTPYGRNTWNRKITIRNELLI